MNKDTITINIAGTDDMDRAAGEFVNAMQGATVVAFHGQMGAGKTTFIAALCRRLGVADTVTSPTFAIVNEYVAEPSGESIYHFDFYRLKSEAEAMDIGLMDYIYSGRLCLMEWPEMVDHLLPEGTLHATIEELPDGTRRMVLQRI